MHTQDCVLEMIPAFDYLMALKYTDPEIEESLLERKPLPVDWRNRLRIKLKQGHVAG